MPIQRPPHMSAKERRRYARTLALPEAHPERRFLQAFFAWWATCVGAELSDIDLAWQSRSLGHEIKLSELLYILLSCGTSLLDALNMKRPGEALAKATSEAKRNLPTLRLALREAAPESQGETAAIIDRTGDILNCLEEMLDGVGGVTASNGLASE